MKNLQSGGDTSLSVYLKHTQEGTMCFKEISFQALNSYVNFSPPVHLFGLQTYLLLPLLTSPILQKVAYS